MAKKKRLNEDQVVAEEDEHMQTLSSARDSKTERASIVLKKKEVRGDVEAHADVKSKKKRPREGTFSADSETERTSKKKEVRGDGEAHTSTKSKNKRPSEGTDVNAEGAKMDEENMREDNKNWNVQKLWSEEDEILVLQGMVDFKKDTEKSPHEDFKGFYKFVKKSINSKVRRLNQVQVVNKIHRLKTKYIGKRDKEVEPSFLNAHDEKCFELSQLIWGLEYAVKPHVKTRKRKKLEEEEKEEEEEDRNVLLVPGGEWFESTIVGSIVSFGMDEGFVKERWNMLPMKEKKKIEDNWKELKLKEAECVLHKTKLLHLVASAIVEDSPTH